MPRIDIMQDRLKQVLKDALVEVLEERREYLRDVIEEVLEEFEMVEDHREIGTSDRVRRRVAFEMPKGEA